jgi:hypothetical protein
MPGYSLVPVDYQPDFDDCKLVPVDYDPFAGDGPVQQAQFQQAQFQQPPTPTQPAQPQPQTQPQQEPVSPASTGRRPATAPAHRVAALASAMQELVQATRFGLKAGHPSLLPLTATPIRRQRSL